MVKWPNIKIAEYPATGYQVLVLGQIPNIRPELDTKSYIRPDTRYLKYPAGYRVLYIRPDTELFYGIPENVGYLREAKNFL